MKIEKEAEKILEEFSKALEGVPELEETYYIVDNSTGQRRTGLKIQPREDPQKRPC